MKIVTAIGNPYLNKKLKECQIGEIIGTDIQYAEGIIEFLEENKDIDLIILSNILPGEYDLKKIINEIKKKNESIEIIVFLKEKDEYIENFLNSKNIYKIYYLYKKDEEKFLNTFSIENKKIDIKAEIEDLKSLILTNKKFNLSSEMLKESNDNNIIKKNKVKLLENNIKKVENKKENTEEKIRRNKIDYLEKKHVRAKEYNSKIIVISGNFSSGKSLISIFLSKYIESKNRKILLIDFDINNNINTILGVKKAKGNNLEEMIEAVDKNLYVLCGTDIFLENLDGFSTYKISEFLENIKNNFDFIIIDISSKINLKYVEKIFQKADKIIFLLEPNFLELKKARSILEVYLNDWHINNKKVKLLLNKVNKYKISDEIISEFFSKIELIGSIKYNENYTLFINKNFNNYVCEKEYEKIYENILN